MLVGMALAAVAILAMRRGGSGGPGRSRRHPIRSWPGWSTRTSASCSRRLLWGRRRGGAEWHWDDIERGGSEKRAAKERVGPLRWIWTRLGTAPRQREAGGWGPACDRHDPPRPDQPDPVRGRPRRSRDRPGRHRLGQDRYPGRDRSGLHPRRAAGDRGGPEGGRISPPGPR